MKNKAATNGGKRRAFTAASVVDPLFTQEDDEVFVTGSTLYAGDEGRSNPLGHNPRFLLPQDIVGQNPAGIFVEN